MNAGDNERLAVGFSEIVFATDFSEISAMALPYAAALARRFDARLCVVHVMAEGEYAELAGGGSAEEGRAEALRGMRRRAEERVTQLLQASHFRGIRHDMVLDHGEMLATLSAVVERRKADLIVLGMHGKHGLQKMLLGSKAEEILRLAGVPVLVVGPEVTVAPEAEVEMRHILYVADFSPGSGRALRYAGELARRWGAQLIVLHVVPDIWAEPLSTHMPGEAFLRLRLLEREWMACVEDLQPELAVEFGSVEERILERAERHRVELMVMECPETEHPALVAHLPGPLAYNIASHARCPVLVVRGT
jgi:nucleotide-binding universal stress UspA family protein